MDHLRRPFMATRASFPQELFDEDLDRISSLNLSTYRMQLSWSRLHTSRGGGPESFDMEALERYRGFLTAMQDGSTLCAFSALSLAGWLTRG